MSRPNGSGEHSVEIDGRAERTRAFVNVAICIVAVALMYGFVIVVGPSNLIGQYDVFRYFVPKLFFSDYAIHQGEFPLWNALTFCGYPIAANPQTLVFYPPNFIRSLISVEPTPMKTQTGFIVLLGIHLVLCAYTTYRLGRAHQLSRGGAFAAAFAFTFSALMTRRVGEFHFLTTLAWLPLLLLLTKRSLDARDTVRRIGFAGGAGLVLGLSILGGFLQLVPYVCIALAAYGFFHRLLCLPAYASPAAWPRWQTWLSDALMLGLILSAAALIASILLVPLLELVGFTDRVGDRPMELYSDLKNTSAVEFLKNMLVYPGIQYRAEALRGSGIIALLLVCLSLTHPNRRRTALFAALFIVLFDCTIGPPMPVASLVTKLTPFLISAHTRAFEVALLPLSLLAGMGVDALSTPPRSPRANGLRAAFVAIAGASMVAVVAFWMGLEMYLPVSRATGLAAPLAAILLMICATRIDRPRLVQGLLAGLIFVEIYAWNWYFIPHLARRNDLIYSRLHVEQQMPQDNRRRADPSEVASLMELDNIMNGYEPLYLARARAVISGPERGTQYKRAIRSWEILAESHRGNLLLKRSFWLARQWALGSMPEKTELFPTATTVFLTDTEETPLPDDLHDQIPRVARADLPNSGVSASSITVALKDESIFGRPVQASQGFKARLDFNLPKAIAGRKAGPAGSLHSVLRLYYRTTYPTEIRMTFRNRTTGRVQSGKKHTVEATGPREGVVETPIPDFRRGWARIVIPPTEGGGSFEFTHGEVLSDESDEDGLIEIVSRRINAIDLTVGELKEPRLLTYLDADYPGWHAYVDSQPTAIYRANDAFKAILVPPGTHDVRFEFRSRTLPWGALMSGLGFVLCGTGLVVARARRQELAVTRFS